MNSYAAQPFRRFGEHLRGLRAGRLLSISDVVAHLRDADYALTSDTYATIEEGVYLPEDAGYFLDTIGVCFALTHQQRIALLGLLAYEILREALGDTLASDCLDRPDEASPEDEGCGTSP